MSWENFHKLTWKLEKSKKTRRIRQNRKHKRIEISKKRMWAIEEKTRMNEWIILTLWEASNDFLIWFKRSVTICRVTLKFSCKADEKQRRNTTHSQGLNQETHKVSQGMQRNQCSFVLNRLSNVASLNES